MTTTPTFRDTLDELAHLVVSTHASAQAESRMNALVDALKGFDRVHTEFIQLGADAVLVDVTPGRVTAELVSPDRYRAYSHLRQTVDKGDVFQVYVTSDTPTAEDPVARRVTLKVWSLNALRFPQPRTWEVAQVLGGDLGSVYDDATETLVIPVTQGGMQAASHLRDRLRRLVSGRIQLNEL